MGGDDWVVVGGLFGVELIYVGVFVVVVVVDGFIFLVFFVWGEVGN